MRILPTLHVRETLCVVYITCQELHYVASSETQGQLEGAGKRLGRRKVKNEEKSSSPRS